MQSSYEYVDNSNLDLRNMLHRLTHPSAAFFIVGTIIGAFVVSHITMFWANGKVKCNKWEKERWSEQKKETKEKKKEEIGLNFYIHVVHGPFLTSVLFRENCNLNFFFFFSLSLSIFSPVGNSGKKNGTNTASKKNESGADPWLKSKRKMILLCKSSMITERIVSFILLQLIWWIILAFNFSKRCCCKEITGCFDEWKTAKQRFV